MLSYRHAFHAGNPADVLKHAVLAFCLDYLCQKEKPFFCADTHAGAGSYPLLGGFAAKNREWEQGVAKLRGRKGEPAMIRRYRELAGFPGEDGALDYAYPGSPALTARLLRPQDRGLCFELHPGDFAALSRLLGGDRRFILRQEDGFAGLKAFLPPPSRRGLIFTDPSYELKEDYGRLGLTLREALRRFPTGIYLVWYPLLGDDPRPESGAGIPDDARGNSLGETLLGLYRGRRCALEFYTASSGKRRDHSPRGFYGSGMVIYNPPWPLDAALRESLPFLGETLGIGPEGWRLDTR
ncbi:MAG: 23S rRNA (adenine(2030)-N(6))-methyltransferase RlmJ [Treponema sp.]|jgi:23S rRNA (adenine2030-N6)-methyltransferase|nr:23S rRNA (adenine(2030)-N(6))-methyltransferase RlmJ [Treponema sp.]